MNTGFYKDLDTNFEQALVLSEKDFSHEELLLMLENGNIPEKQIAALKLDSIDSTKDAEILVSNLTGCDGKIREAVALKINQLLRANASVSKFIAQPEIFADASIDINANICRLVIDSVAILISKDNAFKNIYKERILNFINEAFQELDKFIFRDKKYVINKQLFKLYWCLEALKLFAQDIDLEILQPILERAAQEKEYTIRERVAHIVILKEAPELNNLKEYLKSDENYYVRNVFG